MSMCRFLCGHKLSTHLSKYQGALLLDCMERVCLILLETVEPSSRVTVLHFAFLPAMNESSCCSRPCQHLVLSVFWILAILIGV